MAVRLHLDPNSGQYKMERSGTHWLRKLTFALSLVLITGIAFATLARPKGSAPLSGGGMDASPLFSNQFSLDPPLVRPQLGQVRLGAYAGEAAQIAGLTQSSIPALSQLDLHSKYRESIRNTYGADLEEMNYFSVGAEGWQDRIDMLRQWLIRAGQFGEVTIGLEPTGKQGYGVFKDSAGMRALRSAFQDAEDAGIAVVIRFASEANLRDNPYSAYGSRARAEKFFNAATWFKSYMGSRVVLVFSPLINTAVHGDRLQHETISRMFNGPEPGQPRPWDRIGGTIYRTNVRLAPTFTSYYQSMSKHDPSLPFQICEVGGPYSRRFEVTGFLADISNGKWPRVEKVNLFARDINRRADPNGSFGFIDPVKRAIAADQAVRSGTPQLAESFLKPLIEGNTP